MRKEVEERLEVKLKRQKKVDITKTVLLAVAAVGFLAVAIAAPNLIGAIAKLSGYKPGKNRYAKYDRKYYVLNRIRRMEERGLIQKVKQYDKMGYILTNKGRLLLYRYGESVIQSKAKKKWDGNWRIVIYDIWERTRRKRDYLREFLKRLGFIQLQNSVWVSPYDSEELIFLLKTDLKVGRGVIYLTSNSIEGDYLLREKFNL